MPQRQKQIQFSKDSLLRAFLNLIEEKDYSSITVENIVERSLISKPTFYRHFRNKSDLLHYYFQQLLADYLTNIKQATKSYSYDQVLINSFAFWYQHHTIFRRLITQNVFHELLNYLHQHRMEIYQASQAPWHDYDNPNPKANDVYAAFLMGGYYNMIRNWLKQENPESPEELAANFFEGHKNLPDLRLLFSQHKD